MPKSPLAAKVAEKIKSEKLSVTAAAKAIGVNAPGLAAVLRGKSSPNARTRAAYARFLGIGVEEVAALAGREPTIGTNAPKKGGAKASRAPKPSAAPTGRRAATASGVSLAEAVALAGDALAVAVHRLDGKTREMIGRLLR